MRQPIALSLLACWLLRARLHKCFSSEYASLQMDFNARHHLCICWPVSRGVTWLRYANTAERIEVLLAWGGDFWGPKEHTTGVPMFPHGFDAAFVKLLWSPVSVDYQSARSKHMQCADDVRGGSAACRRCRQLAELFNCLSVLLEAAAQSLHITIRARF